MADQYVSNFAIPATTNIFQLIWKLTRTMKAAGWTVMASSDHFTKDTSGVAANDLWGGNVNPLADTYGGTLLDDTTTGGWIVLRGPSTIKVPLSANPTGTFIRGETVTQATSAAEGELIGYVWDSVGLSGWAVILPHTGTFDNSHVVTGSTSTATFTPTGTVVEYVREFVFGRDTSSTANAKINGWIWYICADVVGENALLPSTLATAAGCTAVVPPGGGGTSNAFPSKGILIRGTSTALGYSGWITSSTNTFSATNNGQIFAKNATPATGVSADGSWGASCTNTTTANAVDHFGYQRLDDTEPGDVDPFVVVCRNNSSLSAWNGTSTAASTISTTTWGSTVVGSPDFQGYQARGCPITTRDVVAAFGATFLYYGNMGGTASSFIGAVWSAARFLQNHPAASTPVLREPLTIGNAANGAITNSSPTYKGRCRWAQIAALGTTYDTYDAKTWLVVGVASASVPVLLVPYDGVTVPTL